MCNLTTDHVSLYYRIGKRPGYGRGGIFSTKRVKQEEVKPETETTSQISIGNNHFSNDGSFLEKFMKLQGQKREPCGLLFSYKAYAYMYVCMLYYVM